MTDRHHDRTCEDTRGAARRDAAVADYLNGAGQVARRRAATRSRAFRAALLDGDTRTAAAFHRRRAHRMAGPRPRPARRCAAARGLEAALGRARDEIALVAVGGYGRGELHPCSDIDVLVLLPKSEHAAVATAASKRFLTFLWDIGLEVGHSVRTIDECQRESAADISVATTLIEARLLAGPELLFEAMRRALAPERVWPAKDFFEAKVDEQTGAAPPLSRHRLQPRTQRQGQPRRIARHPDDRLGGEAALRRRVPRRTGGPRLPTRSELRKLKTAQAFLWKVRFALHVLTGRREDRLLFDHQIRLAKMFGYEDATYTLAVEQFMQRYYRTVMDMRAAERNAAAAVPRGDPVRPQQPARAGQCRASRSATIISRSRARTCSTRFPSALLEVFVVLEQNSEGARRARRRPSVRSRAICG